MLTGGQRLNWVLRLEVAGQSCLHQSELCFLSFLVWGFKCLVTELPLESGEGEGGCGWVEEKAAVLVVSFIVTFPIGKSAWWHGYCSLFVSLHRSGMM